MISAPLAAIHGPECWNRIGISGDRSCPELQTHIHCRNCPVFAAAAVGFFDRSAPDGYLAEWADFLATPLQPTDSRDISLLIFRLNGEWLAFRTVIVVEVTSPRPLHRVPHRSNDKLAGLVALRGQLQLQVSLHGLLGIDPDDAGISASATPRLVVIKREAFTWAFLADEVRGVGRFSKNYLTSVPSTLANPATSFSQSVLSWRGQSVGVLDDQRVFAALKGLSR